MAEAEIAYCDDYEAIVGPKPKVKAKVVTAPEVPAPETATAETKAV